MGGHGSPGSQGVSRLGAWRNCAELSAWVLVVTMSVSICPSVPEGSWGWGVLKAA